MRQTPQHPQDIARQDEAILLDNVASRSDPAIGVLKRCALLVGTGGLQLYDSQGKSLGPASDASWPIGSYLSGHGGRVLVTIPPGSDGSLFNWLTTGDPAKAPSTKKTQEEAQAAGGAVYNRRGATHDTVVKNGKVIELKGFWYGLRDVVKSYFFEIASNIAGIFSKTWKAALLRRSVTQHYGVDMQVDRHSTHPGQYPGHIYFHSTPATDKEPGSIMFGMEGFPPTDSRHSKVGASDPLSMTGGPKWQSMGDTGDKKYPVPATYNGQRIEALTERQIAALVKVKTSNIRRDIIKARPADSPAGTTFVPATRSPLTVRAPKQHQVQSTAKGREH